MKIITFDGLQSLKRNQFLKIEDENYYAWHLTYDSDLVQISYGIFSNPIEYKTIILDSDINTMQRINSILEDAKKFFFNEIQNREDMKLNYCH